MASMYSCSSLTGLVSSNRRLQWPPNSLAMPKFRQIDFACPMCRYPLGSGGKRVTMCECLPSRKSAATISRMKSNRSGWLGVTMLNKTRVNLDDLNPCSFGFGHRRRHSPRVYPTAFRCWMQRSAKPATGRWHLSLADRLADEGRQRGTSLYRACGRGTEIALPAGNGSVRRPARLKQGGEMNS